jgi:DNA repair protein RadC
MKIRELCADERPREKMIERGAASLSNAELLAILLRTGTGKKNVIEVAQTILSRVDGELDALAGMSIDVLCETEGVGVGKAVSIVAAFELARRWFSEEGVTRRRKISSPEEVFRMMYPLLRDLESEECWVIYLNNANVYLGKERLSVGGTEATVLDSKVVLRKACEKKASGIILVHNHPSGNAYPSPADITRTRAIRNALKACEMSLIDHVVIGSCNYYSFSDERLIDFSLPA